VVESGWNVRIRWVQSIGTWAHGTGALVRGTGARVCSMECSGCKYGHG